MKKTLSLVLSFLFLLSLTACSNGNVTAPSETPAPQEMQIAETAAPFEVPAETALFPATLTDQAGREVKIEKMPERIVSGYFISTSACIALGISNRLVGIEAKAAARTIYRLAAPELLELPNVGSAKEFNLEGCIALEPDLVILPKKLNDSAQTLSALGIPVLLVNPENHKLLAEAIQLIAAASGTSDKAEALISYYDEAETKIAGLVAGLDKPLVYFAGNSAYLSTAPKDMYQASLVRTAGGMNAGDSIEGDNWTEISYEQLLAINPEIIVIPAEASYTKDDLLQDEALLELSAVKSGKIFAMPADFEPWDSPVPSGILGSMWLSSVLHGDVYSMDSFIQDMTAFYSTFYGFKADTSFAGAA